MKNVIKILLVLPIIEENEDFYYDGRYDIPGKYAAEIEDIVDFAFQQFADIPETKRKSVLLVWSGSLAERGA
jgi:hypothetical protein